MGKGLAFALALGVALAAAGGASGAPRRVSRPLYIAPEPVLAGPHVALHYTKLGGGRPPLADVNRDGVPDYVATAAAAANRAWVYYEHSGFRPPLPDTGGGSRVDVYVMGLPRGLDGITVPSPGRTEGPFMVISNRLTTADRPTQGSLQQAIAHELFHVWQLSYGRAGGLPGWVMEGSATAMETAVYPQIADQLRSRYERHWLREPWRSLDDERNGCDHCYGSALWWQFVGGLGNDVVPEYFGRLAGDGGTGTGTQPLDETITRHTGGKENLSTAFSRFSYELYRSGRRPAAFTHLTASTAPSVTQATVVRGLSAHYIPIGIPAGAQGISVAVAAAGGPSPEAKLVVGGPKGRAVVEVARAGERERLFETTFANPAEARTVLLIVTSGRRAGAAYTVAYRAVRSGSTSLVASGPA